MPRGDMFGKGRSGREITLRRSDAMIKRHSCHAFAANDALCIPAGCEAILVRGGACGGEARPFLGVAVGHQGHSRLGADAGIAAFKQPPVALLHA